MGKLKVLYEPKGKAGEYAQGALACNLYRGCGHGCVDCYAPAVIRLNREEFNNNPQPRKGIIEKLRQDAESLREAYESETYIAPMFDKHYKKPPRPEVFLCFTTDPYQPINKEHQLTRQAIEILHDNEIAVNVLTKGKITDFDLLAKRPDLSKVGVTLTSTHHATSRQWEPEACLPMERCRNLQQAKDLGIPTWVSLEPARSLNSVKSVISLTHSIVDEYKLGKWNYDPRAKNVNWHELVTEAINLFEKYSCKYYIKEDLRQYI